MLDLIYLFCSSGHPGRDCQSSLMRMASIVLLAVKLRPGLLPLCLRFFMTCEQRSSAKLCVLYFNRSEDTSPP